MAKEIYRQAARTMIRKFGSRAKDRATTRASDLELQGDQEGFAMWMEVCVAIDEIRGVFGDRRAA
jgi:hypothetical protein